jgi:HEAT repeat protein
MRNLFVAFVIAGIPAICVAGDKPEDLSGDAWTVMEKATRSGDMLARSRAIETLPLVPGKDATPYIQEAVKDPQWVVRKAAIKALARRGDADAGKAAAESLRDPSVPIEDDAFDLLAGFKQAEAQQMLIAAVLDPQTPTRDKLMRAILARGVAWEAPVFAAGLAKDDAYFVQEMAQVRREEQPELLAALLKEKDAKVVAATLKFVFDRQVILAPAALKPFLKSADADVRNAAAELLAHQGDVSAVKVLLPLLDGDAKSQERFLKAAAAAPSDEFTARLKKYLDPATPVELLVPVYRSLAKSSDAEILKRIEDDLNSTILPRRAAATMAIGRLMGPRSLPRLNQLLVDGSPVVRRLAAQAIGELGQAESVEVLERALRDTERDVRLAVIQAIAKIHDKSVIGVASFVVYDNDPEIRKTAILAVCGVNHDSALPILRINVEDADPEIRLNVVKALTYLDPKMSLEYFDRALGGLRPDDLVLLTETFKDAFLPFLKRAAVSERAWARTGSLRAIRWLPALESDFLKEIAATNAYADTRRAAMERLEQLSCKDALDVSDALFAEKDPEVRIAAIATLVRCGDATYSDKLKAALLDPEENVRVAAAAAVFTIPKAGSKRPDRVGPGDKAPDKKPPAKKGK